MALRAVLGPWTQLQSRDSGGPVAAMDMSLLSAASRPQDYNLGTSCYSQLCWLLKGLIPKSHIPTCLDSELGAEFQHFV